MQTVEKKDKTGRLQSNDKKRTCIGSDEKAAGGSGTGRLLVPYKPDYSVQQMIDAHMELFRKTDMDIIKIMQDYPYPISGEITCADDWYKIQVKGTDSEEFAKMAEITADPAKSRRCVLIFQTMSDRSRQHHDIW